MEHSIWSLNLLFQNEWPNNSGPGGNDATRALFSWEFFPPSLCKNHAKGRNYIRREPLHNCDMNCVTIVELFCTSRVAVYSNPGGTSAMQFFDFFACLFASPLYAGPTLLGDLQHNLHHNRIGDVSACPYLRCQMDAHGVAAIPYGNCDAI